MQLLATGLPEHVIDRRVRSGRLVVVHRGVYRLPGELAQGARELAAALACGPDAVVGLDSALALWEMAPPLSPDHPVAILVVGSARRVSGVRVRRVLRLRDEEVTRLGRRGALLG